MQSTEDLNRIKAKRGAVRARATRTITIIEQLASTEPSNITNGIRQHLVSSEQVLNQTLSDLTSLDGQIHDQLSPDEIPADDEKCFDYQEKIFHLSVLFKASCVEENDGRGLRKLMEHAHEQRLAFQAMGFDMNEMADIFMVYIIVEKLDRESLKQWELANPGKDSQRYDQLYRFLQSPCQALEAADVMRDHNAFNLDGRNGPSSPSKGHNKSFNKGKSHSLSINQHNCYSCEEAHKVFHCPKFKSLGVDARRELVNHKKASFNCLQQGHVSKQCPSTSTCRTCGARHNTLLHND